MTVFQIALLIIGCLLSFISAVALFYFKTMKDEFNTGFNQLNDTTSKMKDSISDLNLKIAKVIIEKDHQDRNIVRIEDRVDRLEEDISLLPKRS